MGLVHDRVVDDGQQVASYLDAFADATPDLVIAWTADGEITYLNPAAEAVIALDQREAPARVEHVLATVPTPNATGTWEGRSVVMAPDGTGRTFHGVAVREPQSGVMLLIARTEIIGSPGPSVDVRTGLVERASFIEVLRRLAAPSDRRQHHATVVVCELPLDAPDDAMTAAAQAVVAAVRPGDLVGRLDVTCVAVLCTNALDHKVATALSERLEERARRAAALVTDLPIDAAVGYALLDDVDGDLLATDADAAIDSLRRVATKRRAVRGAASIRSTAEIRVEHALHGAVQRGEVRVVYQPQFSLINGQLVGAEALVRWEHPELGNVSPALFIPIAERSGAIGEIGRFVLHEACTTAQRWALDHEHAEALDLHVNLSPGQFAQADLVQQVAEVLAATGLAPHRLCLEITETAVMERIEDAIAVLIDLRSLGIKVGVDDFGVGYSSLSYLRKLPVDVLKLDKSFIDRLGEDATDSAIVAAVINLARCLELTVVAEGVEHERQRRELRALGCALAQGYYFSKPLEVDEVASLVADSGW